MGNHAVRLNLSKQDTIAIKHLDTFDLLQLAELSKSLKNLFYPCLCLFCALPSLSISTLYFIL